MQTFPVLGGCNARFKSLVCRAPAGYLPIAKTGADLLFQIVSQRYERGATVITTNRLYRKWPEIFNNDATLTSPVLDRLLHDAQTVVTEGKSFRMKDANTETLHSSTS